MRHPVLSSLLFTLLATGSALTLAEPDWSKVAGKEIPAFFPGPAGIEWIMNNADHTGARKLSEKKQSCVDCHEYDADQIGRDIVAGKKVGKARVVIDGDEAKLRRDTFPLLVKAAHDDKKLWLRFEWEGAAPGAAKQLDPKNEIKLSVMFDRDQVDGTKLGGCWATCHMDLRTMPDTNDAAKKHARAKAFGWSDGVTKYIAESRTTLAFEGKPRGGWDKLRSDKEIAAALKDGKFLDLMQFRSGEGEKGVDGYVLESRHMGGGKSLIKAVGAREGNRWSVTFERLLEGAGVGDHSIVAGKPITFGVSIHENHAAARYHHVSLGYTLGLDDPAAFVNATRLPVAGERP